MFFDLISHPGGQSQFPEKKKKTEEVLGQVVWIRALRCVVWKEGGQRGQEVSPRPVQKAGQTVRLIRNACRSFLGSRVDSAAGKDGRERGGNGQVFLVCHTDSPPPLASSVPTALSRASSTLHFLHNQSRQAEMSQQQPDSHSGFIAAFQTPWALSFFTVNSQDMTQTTEGADRILKSTMWLLRWEKQISENVMKYCKVHLWDEIKTSSLSV